MNSEWLLFVSHLPSRERAPRMRVWRSLRSLGAAILRDGAYLLPWRPDLARALAEQADVVDGAGGVAHRLRCRAADAAEEARFRALFERDEAYRAWHRDAADLNARLTAIGEAAARREAGALGRALDAILATDYFPGDAHGTARAAMDDLRATIDARFSPHEPTATGDRVARRDAGDYQGRIWATRRSLWVDRVASAWLIRRSIDPGARFLWLDAPADCPADAVGFDFDGAPFSHVGDRVTFEVLMETFDLGRDRALARLGALVHHLDVGGAPVPESPGVLALLSAARERCDDDDAFLEAASVLFDDLCSAFDTPGGAPG